MNAFDENVKRAVVVQGDTFVVQLEGLPSAGFLWNPLPCEGLRYILELNAKTAAANDGSVEIGGACVQTFLFEAVIEGEHTLEFEYKRPFEDKPSANAHKLIVMIARKTP